jgi:hypothetical protein
MVALGRFCQHARAEAMRAFITAFTECGCKYNRVKVTLARAVVDIPRTFISQESLQLSSLSYVSQ